MLLSVLSICHSTTVPFSIISTASQRCLYELGVRSSGTRGQHHRLKKAPARVLWWGWIHLPLAPVCKRGCCPSRPALPCLFLLKGCCCWVLYGALVCPRQNAMVLNWVFWTIVFLVPVLKMQEGL